MTVASAAAASLFDPRRFDNRFVRELPGDPEERNFRRQVHGACWSHADPTPVAAPRVLAHSKEVAALLDIDDAAVRSDEFANIFGGNALADGMTPYAACYGGHQFGSWAGQLGDGRAIGLGEYVNARGERWELQLKGAGPTPYSRTADGRAVLRSSIREFLCSEAMHHLGVPTTRALCLVETGEPVVRDMLYDGNPRPEPGAIVCRVAPSFIRFGNFEILAARDDIALFERLVDFTIARDFPEIEGDTAAKRTKWFHTVCERTAVMIAHWMRVGFVHGVMNTDNMSILGLTIDYGPYGWVDNYDPGWTPNTTDAATHRYAFGRQPSIALWNLACLANALTPSFASIDDLKEGLEVYKRVYIQASSTMALAKFGFGRAEEGDENLVDDAMQLLFESEADMTIFFRGLAKVSASAPPSIDLLGDCFYDDGKREAHSTAWNQWLTRYAKRIATGSFDDDERRAVMNGVNPIYVMRNYLAQQAIDRAEAGDAGGVTELLDVMRSPYVEKPGLERFAAKRPDWARTKVGCSMLSCSS